MVSVEDACRIAVKFCNVPFIASITEIDDLYLFGMLNKDGESLCDGAHTVNKNTGENGVFRRSKENCMNLLKNGKQIEVPEKYRFVHP